MKTVTMPDGCTLTFADDRRADALKRAIANVKPSVLYDYENVDGSITRGTFEGYEGLNAKFRRTNGQEFLVPISDMGDGSFFTEYLKQVPQQ
jgi:hypothetical protein